MIYYQCLEEYCELTFVTVEPCGINPYCPNCGKQNTEEKDS